MRNLKLKLIGVSPLILHNGRLADPIYPITKEIKKISSKRLKTESDFEQMAKLEFLGSLYVKDGKIVIPSEMIEACLVDGAKKKRLGKDFKSAVWCENHFPLIYEGEQSNFEKLYKNENFVISCLCVVNRARIVRTRPIFKKWSVNVEISYNEEIINEHQILEAVSDAGQYCGMGDWRPKYGRFKYEII